MVLSPRTHVGWEKADGWEWEWERRMCLSSEEDTVRGTFLNGTLEAVRAVGGEPLVLRCLEASGESSFLDFYNYPLRLHSRMMSLAMPALCEAHAGAEEALRQVGQHVAGRFLRMGVGKVMLSVRPLSPWQLQSTLPMAYRTTVSFGEYAVRWTGPRSGCFTLKRDFMPYPFHEGVMRTSLELWGGRAVRVSGRQIGGLDSECDFWWQ